MQFMEKKYSNKFVYILKVESQFRAKTYGGPWLGPVCVGETDNGPIDDGGV